MVGDTFHNVLYPCTASFGQTLAVFITFKIHTGSVSDREIHLIDTEHDRKQVLRRSSIVRRLIESLEHVLSDRFKFKKGIYNLVAAFIVFDNPGFHNVV